MWGWEGAWVRGGSRTGVPVSGGGCCGPGGVPGMGVPVSGWGVVGLEGTLGRGGARCGGDLVVRLGVGLVWGGSVVGIWRGGQGGAGYGGATRFGGGAGCGVTRLGGWGGSCKGMGGSCVGWWVWGTTSYRGGRDEELVGGDGYGGAGGDTQRWRRGDRGREGAHGPGGVPGGPDCRPPPAGFPSPWMT